MGLLFLDDFMSSRVRISVWTKPLGDAKRFSSYVTDVLVAVLPLPLLMRLIPSLPTFSPLYRLSLPTPTPTNPHFPPTTPPPTSRLTAPHPSHHPFPATTTASLDASPPRVRYSPPAPNDFTDEFLAAISPISSRVGHLEPALRS